MGDIFQILGKRHRRAIIHLIALQFAAAGVSTTWPYAANAAQAGAHSSAPSTLSNDPSANADFSIRNERYRLAATDTIALAFPITPEFNQTVSVGPDGFVALTGAGSVHVEGMTTDEAAT